MHSPAKRDALPMRLGRYELLVPLGEGGMARVYLGRRVGPRGFQRDVAIKVMRPELALSGEGRAVDLALEARLAAQIHHPNVVPVLDVGEEEDGVFLVMDYVEGDTLAALQKASGGRVPIPVALRILSDVLSGLHAAHELEGADGAPLGVVHRDFSPQNILVGLDGMSRLTDFGIAKAAFREGVTQSGLIKGKVGYLSPEQAQGKRLDARSDVWAAGVVAWELFAGERLYKVVDPSATALEIVTGSPRRLREVNPEIGERVETAVHYALEKELDRRCSSACAYRECLLQAAGVQPASAAEVGAFVRELVGHKLEDMRLETASAAARHRDAPAAVETPSASEALSPALIEANTQMDLVTRPTGVAKTPRARRALKVAALVAFGGTLLGASLRSFRAVQNAPAASSAIAASTEAPKEEPVPPLATNATATSPAAAPVTMGETPKPPPQAIDAAPPTQSASSPKSVTRPTRPASHPHERPAGATPSPPPTSTATPRPAASNPYG
jgi:eukaryotic-like serine/threonine-protein kinase